MICRYAGIPKVRVLLFGGMLNRNLGYLFPLRYHTINETSKKL